MPRERRQNKQVSVWGRGPSAKALSVGLDAWRWKARQHIIRWGYLGDVPDGVTEINTAEAIRKASHKFESLKLMEEAGVRVPSASKDVEEVGFPCLGRNFFHSKGRDIEVYAGRECLPDYAREYYVQLLPNDAEYRVHVAFGKVIAKTKKVPTEAADLSVVQRNRQFGWAQVTITGETPVLDGLALKAIEAHGLHFGAVDIVRSAGKYYVLEVNTAPGLEVEGRLRAYTEAVMQWVDAEGERNDERGV